MKKLPLGFALAACVAAPGWATNLPAYEETGTFTILLGSEETTHYTTRNGVPGDPDRQIHTASWVILKPMLMGGINMSPDDVFVTITSRDTVAPKAGQASMRVEFSLDPVTLDLKPDTPATVLYHPTGSQADRYYALTHGHFKIESVTKIDANSLAIIATAEGEMSGQESYTVTHNPEDILPLKARFDLQRVVNRSDVSLP